MGHIDDKDISTLQKYEFWFWEYQRRNKEYRDAFNEALKKIEKHHRYRWDELIGFGRERAAHKKPGAILGVIPKYGRLVELGTKGGLDEDKEYLKKYVSDEEKRQYEEELKFFAFIINGNFTIKYGRRLTDPGEGLTSDQIMETIIDGTFNHDIDLAHYSSHDGKIDIKEINGKSFAIIGLDKKDLTSSINDLEYKSLTEKYRETEDPKEREEIYQRCVEAFKKIGEADMRKAYKRFKPAPETRAVGLWLWDYKTSENVNSNTAIKALIDRYRNNLAKLIKEDYINYDPNETENIVIIGISDEGKRRFRDAYDITQRSIEDMVVLPIGQT